MSETLLVTKRTIERDLSVMQKANIIRHEGSDKTGTWVKSCIKNHVLSVLQDGFHGKIVISLLALI